MGLAGLFSRAPGCSDLGASLLPFNHHSTVVYISNMHDNINTVQGTLPAGTKHATVCTLTEPVLSQVKKEGDTNLHYDSVVKHQHIQRRLTLSLFALRQCQSQAWIRE